MTQQYDTLEEMAAAHLKLTQSLLTFGTLRRDTEAYRETMKAVEDLSRAISFRVRRITPPNLRRKEEVVQDWEDLGENVRNHCMGPAVRHMTDGRTCYYHSRLDAWVFDAFTEERPKKCLRSDHQLAMNCRD